MIEWIVSSAVLILVIIALRQLLKGKISLQLQYALWAIVLVRLLVPVSFGQSKLSVQNAVQAGQAIQTEQGESAEPPGITIDIPPSRADYVPPDLSVVEPDPGLPKAEQEQQYEQNKQQWQDIMDADWEEYKAEHTRHVTLSVPDILRVLWLAGIAAVALVFLISNLRFGRRLRRSRQALDVDCPLPVYLSGAVETPCLFGLFRPAVYVTAKVAANPVALAHVLAHETTHFRHWDHIWAVLRCVCLAVHWYNPLVWLAASLSRRDAELACDEGAIRRIGEEERAAYGRTLIGLTCAHRSNLLHTATTMTGGKKSIRERIVLIAKKPKMAVYTLVAVILIAAVAVGCTFTGAEEKKHPFVERIAGVTEFQIGGAYIGADYRVPTTDYEEILSILQGITEEQCIPVTELDYGSNITYRLEISTGLDERWQFYCLQDEENTVGVIFLDEERKTEAHLDGEKVIYLHPAFPDLDGCWLKIRSPELYQYIMGSIEDFRNGTVADADVPDAVEEKAEELLQQYLSDRIAEYADSGESWEFTSAMRGLGQLEINADREGASVKVYQMEYDITGKHETEKLSESRGFGGTSCLVFLDSGIHSAPVFVGAIDFIECANLYGTREMVLEYGDMYTAAAMELYHAWRTDTQFTSETEQLLKQAYIDIVLKGMEGTPVLDRIEIERYYGRYGDAYVALMHGYIAYTDAPWLEEVDGVKFAYPDSRRIRTYTGEDFCTLDEAFERGLLTHADLEQIARLHKAHQQSTAEERECGPCGGA